MIFLTRGVSFLKLQRNFSLATLYDKFEIDFHLSLKSICFLGVILII